jgi:hypothetical protein
MPRGGVIGEAMRRFFHEGGPQPVPEGMVRIHAPA